MKDKKSVLSNQTLEQEITEAEYRLNNCIKRYESLCDTVTLYHEKMRIYLNKCFYNTDGVCILYYDLEISMLNFLIDEMDSVRYDFEHQAPVGELQLLPYVYKNIIKKDETPNITLFDCQKEETYDYLSVPPQEEAREKAYEAAMVLGRVIINTFMVMKKASDESEIESRLLERYKSENKTKLDFYLDHLTDDIKEEKKKLDMAFKETTIGQCYFEAGGMIHETIINMRRKHCVQRDLLPLLEYKAKYDRLTAMEKGEEQPKKAGEANSAIMNDDERVKRAIQAALDKQVAGEYVFKDMRQWTGVFLVLILEKLNPGGRTKFADYLKRLGFNDPRVELPKRWTIDPKVCNKVVGFEEWQITGNTSSKERNIYEVAKIVKEELEKTAKKT